MPGGRINQLYYITHLDNIASILERGILSHEQITKQGLSFTRIYDEEIVSNRRAKLAPNGKSLWDFANLYFQPRNPMLYRVIYEKNANEIAILGVRPDILNREDIFITTGNAASYNTEILPAAEGKKEIPNIRKILDIEYWNEEDGSKRKIMAECLVPDMVPNNFLQNVYVASREAADKLKSDVKLAGVHVITQPEMFFQPSRVYEITPTLTVAEGDMFFSRFQTLTVSVNCVGIMGKGLASRAKFQFPDVYVRYEGLCRRKVIQLGKPYLYKREASFDTELADEPGKLETYNSDTWFLLFATKDHWRQRADFTGIKDGLAWVKDNYEKEGIKSLALPALGCGLGGLDWADVGPLMCRYLSDLKIRVRVFLPTEREISDAQVSPSFLLNK